MADQNTEQTKKELDAFMAAGQEFVKHHPDFNDALHGAAAQGLDLEPAAAREIVRMARPDVVYHLARNPQLAHDLMGKSESRVKDRLARIATDLDLKRTYAAPVARRSEVDDYLAKRREDIKAGRRRK